jgi:type II secretory pathway component PulF
MTSSRRLAAWYFQLAQTLEAGVPVVEALTGPGGPQPAARMAMAERLHGGAPLAGELAAAGSVWLPAVDAQLLAAGAEGGRLPATCRRLAAYHETVARLTGRAVLATLYPLAVVHLGAFALPLRHLVMESPSAYAGRVLAVLVPLWLMLAAVFIVLGRHPGMRRRVFAWLPWVAGYQRARDLGVLAMALEGFMGNGVSPVVAWGRSGQATGAPALEALGRRLAAEAEAGQQPGLALLRERAVPVEFAQSYRTGEQSGQLDESLGWLARRYEEEASRKLGLVALWYPQFALIGVAVWVGINVVAMYAEYLRTLLGLME